MKIYFVTKKSSEIGQIIFYHYNITDALYINDLKIMVKSENGKFKNIVLKARKRLKRALNPNGSILVICICVIMIWRAVWDLCDLYIFPNNQLLSDLVCFVLGVGVLIIHDGNLKDLL